VRPYFSLPIPNLKARSFYETLVNIYRDKMRHIPEGSNILAASRATFARFEVLKPPLLKIIFWDVTRYRFVNNFRHFGGCKFLSLSSATTFSNFGKHLPADTVLHPRRLESSDIYRIPFIIFIHGLTSTNVWNIQYIERCLKIAKST
jgi:hypothetical protein